MVQGQQEPATDSELLGSLTTQQQQRTSARVIKKLRLDTEADSNEKKVETPECLGEKETPLSNVEKCEKDAAHVKKRINWSTVEKSLFFEAINEHGKDFDAVTSYINSKLKKKGYAGPSSEKTKLQVAHFYYRTWHKLSKYVHFDERVKKVAQELYALINYGEMRKKLVSMEKEEKNWPLFEMICNGVAVVKWKGRNVRLRTPMCRALRRLNHLTDDGGEARVPCRVWVRCSARDSTAWCRVQAASHNPRLCLHLASRVHLTALLRALEKRWCGDQKWDSDQQELKKDGDENKLLSEEMIKLEPKDSTVKVEQDAGEYRADDIVKRELLSSPERQVLPEPISSKVRLHAGPKPSAHLKLPTISVKKASRDVSYLAYLNREGLGSEDGICVQSKLKTQKRQRKDSATDVEVSKKHKSDYDEQQSKFLDIDETAIDGIELMASLTEQRLLAEMKNSENEDSNQLTDREVDDNNKGVSDETKDDFHIIRKLEPKTEENEPKEELIEPDKGAETGDPNIDSAKKDTVEPSSDMMDTKVKDEPSQELKNEASEDDKDSLVVKDEGLQSDKADLIESTDTSDTCKEKVTLKTRKEELKLERDEKETSTDSEDSYDERMRVKKKKVQKFTNLKVKFCIRSRKRTKIPVLTEQKQSPPEEGATSKGSWDRMLVTRQAARGWSVYDAGDLTIGDLYLMFGNNWKLDLDYWWAEPTPPLPQNILEQIRARCTEGVGDTQKNSAVTGGESEKESKPTEDRPKCHFDRLVQESEDDRRESDNDILSPRNTFSQDSNDGVSGDEKKTEMSSPEHKSVRIEQSFSAPFRVASKLINNPNPNVTLSQIVEGNYGPATSCNTVPPREQIVTLSSRLQRLISLANIYSQPNTVKKPTHAVEDMEATAFLTPSPPAKAAMKQSRLQTVRLEELPGWSKMSTAGPRLVVRRPLVPSMDSGTSNSSDTKFKKETPPAKINSLPDGVYMMKKINDKIYIISGDKKIPIDIGDGNTSKSNTAVKPTPAAAVTKQTDKASDSKMEQEGGESHMSNLFDNISLPTIEVESISGNDDQQSGISSWMSPSRLLRNPEGDTWLDTADCSLSSLFNQLERNKPPSDVDTQVECMMAESSNDFITKFADLAAQVNADSGK